MNKKDVIINSIGTFFILYGLFAISFAIYRGKPSWIFWFCYVSLVIAGIGAIRKDSLLIASQINLIAFYLITWNIDFFYLLITKEPLWGITDYFFRELLIPARIISLEHLFFLPLGILLLYFIKIKDKNHWQISILQGTVLYLLTIWLTNPQYNVNCAFHSCVSLLEGIKNYQLVWYVISLTLIIITAFILNKIPSLNDTISKRAKRNFVWVKQE